MTAGHEIARRFRDGVLSPVRLTAWAAVSALATLAGPFGTYDAIPLVERAVFWFGVVGLSIVLASLIKAVLRTLAPTLGAWRETAIFAPLLALLLVPMVHRLAVARAGDPGLVTVTPSELALVVLCVSFGVTAIRQVVLASFPARTAAPAVAAPRILQRLPQQGAGKILRISVRDHYVEIVTDRSREKVLMRFSDAIAEAEGIPGLQVHRSHWVAEDAVRGVEREKGRMFLTLEDGSRVPVSRGFRDAVMEAGIGQDAA